MSAYMEKLSFRTDGSGIIDITDKVQNIVRKSNITDGICIVHSMHTTAGLFITANCDKRIFEDVDEQLDVVVPLRNDFRHQFETPTDAAAHVKTAFIGAALTLIVAGGKVLLGTSQGIMFDDFDGPRSRQLYVKVISD